VFEFSLQTFVLSFTVLLTEYSIFLFNTFVFFFFRLGNFSSIKQTLYCTPHYIQLFARNGNYDEGFGLENYKRKWLQRNSLGGESAQTAN